LSTAIAHVAVQWLFASAAALLRCFFLNANKRSADDAPPADRRRHERHALTNRGDVARGRKLFLDEKLTKCLRAVRFAAQRLDQRRQISARRRQPAANHDAGRLKGCRHCGASGRAGFSGEGAASTAFLPGRQRIRLFGPGREASGNGGSCHGPAKAAGAANIVLAECGSDAGRCRCIICLGGGSSLGRGISSPIGGSGSVSSDSGASMTASPPWTGQFGQASGHIFQQVGKYPAQGPQG
jgi:hypothetical protein